METTAAATAAAVFQIMLATVGVMASHAAGGFLFCATGGGGAAPSKRDSMSQTKQPGTRKIRISPECEASAEAFAKRVEELSGIPYPPRNAAELTVLLTRAGFSDERIESTLATLEYPGFEDCPRLPRGYVSTSEASGSHPIFSARLIAGLEAWASKDTPAATGSIPPPKRTKPMTKKKAAKLLGRTGDENRAVEWLNACIEDGTIRWERRSRQSGVYHVDDFPEGVHAQITPN